MLLSSRIKALAFSNLLRKRKRRKKKRKTDLQLQNSLNELSSCYRNNLYCITFEISLCSSLALIHLSSARVLRPACQTVAAIKYFLLFCGELYRIREKVEKDN